MTFEANLAALEKTVKEMESGTLSLDDMMQRFDEGRKLAEACTHELEAARKKIEKLVNPSSEPPAIEPMEII